MTANCFCNGPLGDDKVQPQDFAFVVAGRCCKRLIDRLQILYPQGGKGVQDALLGGGGSWQRSRKPWGRNSCPAWVAVHTCSSTGARVGAALRLRVDIEKKCV